MLASARLAFDLSLPTEDAGVAYFVAPNREERWARRLFERAVGGFYDVTFTRQGWRVRTGGWLRWPLAAQTLGLDDILPSMQTDIVSAGVLLYPAIDAGFDKAAIIQGHEIRFATVDPAANGRTIRRQLLRIADNSAF